MDNGVRMGNRGMGLGPMGNGGTGDMKYRGMRIASLKLWSTAYGPHGQWVTWAGIQGVWGSPKGRGMGTGGGVQDGPRDTGLWATWAMGPMGDLLPDSSCQKDVKLSKRCQMSKNETPRLWRRFTKKLN